MFNPEVRGDRACVTGNDNFVTLQLKMTKSAPMSQLPTLSVMRRPEEELKDRWGIYSQTRSRWIDVVFATEREAIEAADIMHKARDETGRKRG